MPKPKKEGFQHWLGAIIARKRCIAGMAQADVAEYMRRPQSWISRLEAARDHVVTVEELLQLSDCIGFDPGEVFLELRVVSKLHAKSSNPKPRNKKAPRFGRGAKALLRTTPGGRVLRAF
jgi:transcriptional regulator with XRE-family HTH domain